MTRREKTSQENEVPLVSPTHISTADDIDAGVAVLRLLDPKLGDIVDIVAQVPLRLRPAGFKGLAEIVVGQQVSKASAAAIFGRLAAAIDPFEADMFLARGEQVQIDAGLSRAKQVSLQGLAQEIVDGRLDLRALCDVPIDDAMDTLTALRGIGPWTAEVFLLFCAGHSDVFPAGDIALQQAIADIYGLGERPDAKAARAFSERWAPVRGVAARVLWAHYAHLRNRSDIPV